MSMFTLAISCLTTSNLPWFMDLTFQVVLYSIVLYFHHQSHPQLAYFSLWLRLFILAGVISPLSSSSILGIFQPGEFLFQCPLLLPFRAVHGVLKARILSGSPFSSPVDHILSECRRFVTLCRRQWQDHPQGKEMQKGKMVVWGCLINSWEKMLKAKEKRKAIFIWMQSCKE